MDMWWDRIPRQEGQGGYHPRSSVLQDSIDEIWQEHSTEGQVSLVDSLVANYRRNAAFTTESQGRRIYDSIQLALASFRVNPRSNRGRSRAQVLVHQAMFQALLPHIYRGQEWETNQHAILQEHNVEINAERERVTGSSIQPFMLAVASRGFGKTICVAQAAAAAAAYMPAPFSIGIYSQNGRTSKDMMTKIHMFLCQVSELCDSKESNRLTITTTRSPEPRSVLSSIPNQGTVPSWCW